MYASLLGFILFVPKTLAGNRGIFRDTRSSLVDEELGRWCFSLFFVCLVLVNLGGSACCNLYM